MSGQWDLYMLLSLHGSRVFSLRRCRCRPAATVKGAASGDQGRAPLPPSLVMQAPKSFPQTATRDADRPLQAPMPGLPA